MSSIHAIKMTHRHDEMRSALMPCWIDALYFSQCAAAAPEPPNPFHYSLTEERATLTKKQEKDQRWDKPHQ